MIWEEHVKNRNQFPQKELEKFFGKHVAWNLEGTRIVASGEDDLQLYQAVEAAGYDPEQVVASYVPFPDEILMGGAFLSNQDEERKE